MTLKQISNSAFLGRPTRALMAPMAARGFNAEGTNQPTPAPLVTASPDFGAKGILDRPNPGTRWEPGGRVAVGDAPCGARTPILRSPVAPSARELNSFPRIKIKRRAPERLSIRTARSGQSAY